MSSEDLSCAKEESEAGVYAFKIIRLNQGVTERNFICSLVFSMMSILCTASATGLSPLILLDPEYYNVSQDHIGTLNSIILIVQSVVKMAAVIPYGHLSDKIGRRKVIVIGAISYIIGVIIVPIQTTIFPGFIVANILIANSAAALASVPLLADYIADESRGKASAISGVIIFMTSMIYFAFWQLFTYLGFSLGACYLIFGIGGFSGLLINNFGLQGGTFHLRVQKSEAQPQGTTEPPFFDRMKEAFYIFKENGWLKISLVLQILGSSDFGVLMSFIALFIKSLFPIGTPTADQTLAVGKLQMLTVVMMMVSNVACGYLLDKKNLIIPPCLVALGGGAFALVLISIATTPTALTLYLGCILFGLTVPGLFPITSLLNIRNYPADKRGVMNGFSQLVCNVSHLAIAGGGGLLYDNWQRNAPFLICAALLVLAVVLVLIIYSGMKNEEMMIRKENDQKGGVETPEAIDISLEILEVKKRKSRK